MSYHKAAYGVMEQLKTDMTTSKWSNREDDEQAVTVGAVAGLSQRSGWKLSSRSSMSMCFGSTPPTTGLLFTCQGTPGSGRSTASGA